MQTFLSKHFNISEIPFESAYVSIDINDNNVVISIFSEEINQYTYLKTFDFNEISSCKNELIDFFSKFSKRFVLFSSSRFLLLPSSLFDESKKTELFQYNFHDFNPEVNDILWNHLAHLNSHLLFDVKSEIKDVLTEILESKDIYHQGMAFLETCIHFQSEKKQTTPYLFIDISEGSALITMFQNGKLSYFNTNPYVNTADLVFFIVSLIKQYELDQKSVEIFISGKINFSGDEIITEIKKFITKVYPFEYTKNFNISPGLKMVRPYMYNTFFNFPFCV